MPGQPPEFKQLGQKGTEFKGFDTFDAPKLTTEVTFKTNEFTSLCPVTGQPDYQTITISYLPGEKCLESKSLKLYLMTFRNRGAFCEALAAEICDALFSALNPKYLSVKINQNPRGGIGITAEAEKSREDEQWGRLSFSGEVE